MARPVCEQCLSRPATQVVRSVAHLSHPGHPSCTRCLGSVVLRVGAGKATSVGPVPEDWPAPRFVALRAELARAS